MEIQKESTLLSRYNNKNKAMMLEGLLKDEMRNGTLESQKFQKKMFFKDYVEAATMSNGLYQENREVLDFYSGVEDLK